MQKLFIGGKWREARSGADPAGHRSLDRRDLRHDPARRRAADIDAAVKRRARGLRGRLGRDDGDRPRPHADEDGRPDLLARRRACARPRRATPASRWAQARADIALDRALFRILRRRRRQAARPDRAVHGRLPRQVTREPYGVTAHILPWNYPAQMFGRSLAPALAAGNAVVLKPAEEACMSPILLAAIAEEAGIARRRDQCRHRPRRRGRRRADRASRHRHGHLHRLAGSRHDRAEGGGRASHQMRARTRRQVAADRVRRRRPQEGASPSSPAPSPRTAGRPARPEAACWSSARSTTISSARSPRPSPTCASARRR